MINKQLAIPGKPSKGFGLSNTNSGFVLVVVKNYINISSFFFLFKLQSTEESVVAEEKIWLCYWLVAIDPLPKKVNQQGVDSTSNVLHLSWKLLLTIVELFNIPPFCQETVEVILFAPQQVLSEPVDHACP